MEQWEHFFGGGGGGVEGLGVFGLYFIRGGLIWDLGWVDSRMAVVKLYSVVSRFQISKVWYLWVFEPFLV